MTGIEYAAAAERMEGIEVTREAYGRLTGRVDYEAFVTMFVAAGASEGWMIDEFSELARDGEASDTPVFGDRVQAYLLAQ